ncbi:MAG: hypothetical protein RLZZ417_2366 [Bacteroidota bacterium]|jgi:uncharacterized membrane protein
MLSIIFGILIFGIPFFVQKYIHKVPISNFLSPIVICYALGIIMSILNKEQNNSYFEIASLISQISILIAIPMLLYGSSSIKILSGFKTLGISFFIASISSAVSCFFIAFWFKNEVQSFAQVGGMLTGLYIGGTPNLQAIGFALKTDPNLTVQLTAADALTGGSYLILLTSIIPVFTSWILPACKNSTMAYPTVKDEFVKDENLKKEGKDLILLLIFTLSWLSLLLGFLYWGQMITNTALVLFCVTGFSIGSSFLGFISNRTITSFKLGEYLLLVFALALSFQGKWSEIFRGSNSLLILTALSMYGSILLHLVISKIIGIDRDTFLISSTAAIYGPPFVTQVATLLKNKNLLMPGVIAGLCGYAIGNYVGLAVYYLLVPFQP